MSDFQRQQSKRRRTAAERDARRREKQPASSSAAADLEWPRPKGVAFTLPSHIATKRPTQVANSKACMFRDFTPTWDEYDSFYYNGLLNITFEPTQMFDLDLMRHVKWLDQLKKMSRTLGLGTMPFKTYPLYPDLVHQFLASCRVRYTSGDRHASDGTLIFKLDGEYYYLTFQELCALYGFDESGDEPYIPERNEEIAVLWREISGNMAYDSARAKHTDINHPVLRMFVRMLSNTLLCKTEPGKMRKTELVLLHFTIGHHFDYAEALETGHRMNFGGIFAHYLEELKDKGLSGTAKTERIGSLLTPIFQKVRCTLANREVITTPTMVDEKCLKHGKFLDGGWGKYRYRYHDSEGYMRHVRLPSPLCRIDSAEALRFRPLPGDFTRLASDTDRAPRRPSSAVAGTSRTRRSTFTPAPLPPFPEPPAGTYEDNAFRSWMVSTWRTLWDHLRCTGSSDAEPSAAPLPRSRSSAHPSHSEHREDAAADVASDSASSSGSPVF